MLIVRTPFRISFSGGGTDFKDYYEYHSSHIISTTINKYVYVTVNHKFDNKIHLRYSEVECVDTVDQVKHDIIREALKMVGVKSGIEIVTISDIPMKGTGLGSSSALAVGVLNALYNFIGYSPMPDELAEKACELEISRLYSPIGKQDQYASAFGGFNKLVFSAFDTQVLDMKTVVTLQKIHELEEQSMLFYLNKTRKANSVLEEHKNNIQKNRFDLDNLCQLTKYLEDWLLQKKVEMTPSEILSTSWEIKKKMSSIVSDPNIEQILDCAYMAGAKGIKLCGAGAGGFMLVLCAKENQDQVRQALKEYPELKFKFSNHGSEVIYNDSLS